MNISELKADIECTIGSLLTKIQDGKFEMSAGLGSFSCSVDNFEEFVIVRRNFETAETR